MMELKKSEEKSKAKKQTGPFSTIKVKREIKRKIDLELIRINKKHYGKKVTSEHLISLLLTLFKDEHIKVLQEQSLSNSDRLEQQFKTFVSKNPGTTKDDFLGRLLNGGISTFPSPETGGFSAAM